MMNQYQNITLLQFARKHVISLPKEASVAEAIRIMYRNKIRHIPIYSKTEIIGVVNTETIIEFITLDINLVDFNHDVTEVLSTDYRVVSPDFLLFDAVEIICQNPSTVIIIEKNNTILGIYTEIDILDSGFLWHNFTDQPVFSNDVIGTEIVVNSTNTAERSIYDNLLLMKSLHQNYILLTEEKRIQGVIDFFSIIHHIYYTTYRQGKPISAVLHQSTYSIFPSSGMWYKEPIFLSKIRSDMHINDLYYALIMDKAHRPRRIISARDIISYLIENSDYFDNSFTNKV